MGWRSLKNGNLLRQAQGNFDVFLTVDKNIRYQQNTTYLKIALVILRAQGNTLNHLKPVIPKLIKVLETLEPGQIIVIDDKSR